MSCNSSAASNTCHGAASAGSLVQIVALGATDAYLTLDPTTTFFRFRYNKHTNFAMEAVEQSFNTQVAFGSEVQVTVNRVGDLMYFQYIVILLPGIKACTPSTSVCGIGTNQFPCCDPCDPCGDGSPPECVCPGTIVSSVPDEPADSLLDDLDTCTGLTKPWVHYANAIGQLLLKRVCLVIGGQVIYTLYSDFLFMWEELAGKPGKRLTEMIGKRFTRAQLVADSQKDRQLWVPLPWWFTKVSGNALALASLQFHSVQIHVLFESLQKCIQVSDCDVLVVKCGDCQPITANDLAARVETTYIFLDIEERDRFATAGFEQLIDQVQQYVVCLKSCQVRVRINFNHPIIELIWAVRRKCQELCNNYFNYSGKWGQDPVQCVSLRLNNNARFASKSGPWFRLVQPYQHHSLIPDSYVYSYSFALFPELPQPTGSANFSRIDNIELILDLQSALADEEVSVIIFGRNWNVFRYREGLGGLAFSN